MLEVFLDNAANSEKVTVTYPGDARIHRCSISDIKTAKVALKKLQAKANSHDDLLAALESALKNMDNDAVQCAGDWEKGLFCGLEDVNITDRYEACMFGYEKALEKVREWVLCGFDEAIAKAKPKTIPSKVE